jgi:hypothetical protein
MKRVALIASRVKNMTSTEVALGQLLVLVEPVETDMLSA